MSDTYSKQAQSNTVVPTQEEVDRVGFEPTTSSSRHALPNAPVPPVIKTTFPEKS
ncbi:MAG: hypothetical protein ACJ70R_03970 [Nitrososphaera sp.]